MKIKYFLITIVTKLFQNFLSFLSLASLKVNLCFSFIKFSLLCSYYLCYLCYHIIIIRIKVWYNSTTPRLRRNLNSSKVKGALLLHRSESLTRTRTTIADLSKGLIGDQRAGVSYLTKNSSSNLKKILPKIYPLEYRKDSNLTFKEKKIYENLMFLKKTYNHFNRLDEFVVYNKKEFKKITDAVASAAKPILLEQARLSLPAPASIGMGNEEQTPISPLNVVQDSSILRNNDPVTEANLNLRENQELHNKENLKSYQTSLIKSKNRLSDYLKLRINNRFQLLIKKINFFLVKNELNLNKIKQINLNLYLSQVLPLLLLNDET